MDPHLWPTPPTQAVPLRSNFLATIRNTFFLGWLVAVHPWSGWSVVSTSGLHPLSGIKVKLEPQSKRGPRPRMNFT